MDRPLTHWFLLIDVPADASPEPVAMVFAFRHGGAVIRWFGDRGGAASWQIYSTLEVLERIHHVGSGRRLDQRTPPRNDWADRAWALWLAAREDLTTAPDAGEVAQSKGERHAE